MLALLAEDEEAGTRRVRSSVVDEDEEDGEGLTAARAFVRRRLRGMMASSSAEVSGAASPSLPRRSLHDVERCLRSTSGRAKLFPHAGQMHDGELSGLGQHVLACGRYSHLQEWGGVEGRGEESEGICHPAASGGRERNSPAAPRSKKRAPDLGPGGLARSGTARHCSPQQDHPEQEPDPALLCTTPATWDCHAALAPSTLNRMLHQRCTPSLCRSVIQPSADQLLRSTRRRRDAAPVRIVGSTRGHSHASARHGLPALTRQPVWSAKVQSRTLHGQARACEGMSSPCP